MSPNKRNFLLCSGVENGRQAEWDFAYNQYRSSDDGSFLVAITCTRERAIIYKYEFCFECLFSKKLIVFELIFSLLGMMLDPNSIRSEDVDTLFANLAANPLGNTMVCHEHACYSVKNVINVLSLDLGIGFPWSALE